MRSAVNINKFGTTAITLTISSKIIKRTVSISHYRCLRLINTDAVLETTPTCAARYRQRDQSLRRQKRWQFVL